MNGAIDFYGEPRFRAVKIYRIAAQRMLAAKLLAAPLPIAQ
jgi:hypothetical protein